VWRLDPFELDRQYDLLVAENKKEFDASISQIVRPQISEVYANLEHLQFPPGSQTLTLTKVRVGDESKDEGQALLPLATSDLKESAASAKQLAAQSTDLSDFLNRKLHEWKNLGYGVFLAVSTQAQAQRLRFILERSELTSSLVEEKNYDWETLLTAQKENPNL